MDRKLVTDLLKKATVSYWVRKRYSSVCELGVEMWGKRRVDVIAVSMKARVVICEVKSCPSDYLTDSKWRDYIHRCNKFYLVFSEATWAHIEDRVRQDVKGTGTGVMVLCPKSGHVAIRVNAQDRLMTRKNKMLILARLAWRGGTSRRNSRAQRHYIPVESDYGKKRPER